MKKTAIYHYTDRSEKRPKVYKNQIKVLETFAAYKDLCVESVYCDNSRLRNEREEFDHFIADAGRYDALLVKDLYHINLNTKECFRIIGELLKKGISVYTLENGSFLCTDDPEKPLAEGLKVATYNCIQGRHVKENIESLISVEDEILRLFVKSKTSWQIIDQCHDVSIHQVGGDQVQLLKLIACKSNYDLLLVNNVNDIHWRTCNFARIRENLGLNIYSLQEGYIPYS